MNEYSFLMNKKEQILNAVLRLTGDQGLWNTPMSQIASYANMAVGSIYLHYKSKEQLLSELYLKTQEQIAEVLTPLPEFDSYQKEFERLFSEGYFFLMANPYLFKYSAQVGHSPLLSKTEKEKAASYFIPFQDFFEKGINQGAILAGNAFLIKQFTYTQIQALAQTQLDGQLHVTPMMQQQILDRCWNAIKHRDLS